MAGDIKSRQTKHDIVYWVRVELPPGPDGERQQKTLSANSYKELGRQQRDLFHQIDRGGYCVAPKMTLGKFLDDYLDAIKGIWVNTYKGYNQAAVTFKKYLSNTTLLTELRAEVIQHVVNDLSARLEDSTVHQGFTRLKTMMKHAVELDYVSKNPCNGVIVTKSEIEEKAVWDEHQVKQFTHLLKSCNMKKDPKIWERKYVVIKM